MEMGRPVLRRMDLAARAGALERVLRAPSRVVFALSSNAHRIASPEPWHQLLP